MYVVQPDISGGHVYIKLFGYIFRKLNKTRKLGFMKKYLTAQLQTVKIWNLWTSFSAISLEGKANIDSSELSISLAS